MNDLSIYAGDTLKVDITVLQDAAPVDVTEWTFKFCAASSLQKGSGVIGFTLDNSAFHPVDLVNGQLLLVIPPSATQQLGLLKDTRFFHSLVATEADGSVCTLATGNLVVRLAADDALA